MDQEQKPQNITSAQDVFLAPKKPTGLIIATVAASVIALASVATTIVTLVKADQKSEEIAELSAKIERLQQNTATESTSNTTNTTTTNTTTANTALSLAEQLKNAYKNKEGKELSSINVAEQDIKNSTVSPYQTVVANIVIDLGGNYTTSPALFYRVSPNAEWQYFTLSQGQLPCSDYNTDDLKKAYAGETCFNETNGTQSTVQP